MKKTNIYCLLLAILVINGCSSTKEVDEYKDVKETMARMEAIVEALERYKKRCGSYPTTTQGLQALEDPPIRAPLCKKWGPNPYMVDVPLDAWENFFNYELTDGSYKLMSLGSDRRQGGEGIAADISQ